MGRLITAASALAGVTLLATGAAQAQVLELSGGSSSLYQAQGAGLSVRAANYESGVSAGMVSGRFVVGAHATYKTPTSLYTVGIEELRLNLPTDLFDTDHRLLGVGAGIKTIRGRAVIELFGGMTSTRFDTPLFQGAQLEKPAAAFLMRLPLSSTVSWTTQVTRVGSLALLQGLEWRPKAGLALAASSGVVGNDRYNAASVNYKGERLDVQAAYVDFGSKLQRPGSDTDLVPEPIRGNVQITLRPFQFGNLTVSGGRQNSLVPGSSVVASTGLVELSTSNSATGLVSTVDQLSGSARIWGVGVTGTGLHSTFDGRSDMAYMFSASRTLGPKLHVQSGYYASRLTDSAGTHPTAGAAVTTLQEIVNRRLTVSEAITRSNGQTNVSFGGSLLSNLATLSADYQTFYIPTRPANPFQQTLVLDVQLHLFGRLTVHGGTFVAPDGKMLYTTDIKTVGVVAPGMRPATVQRTNFGPNLLAGRVIDVDGAPVAGAAIDVDGTVLVTNSDGQFFMRERKPAAHAYKVLLEDFLDGRTYQVVSKPQMLTSTRGGGKPATIVVIRAGAVAGASQ